MKNNTMKYIKRAFPVLALLLAPLSLPAQQSISSAGVIHPATSAMPTRFSAADIALIENRARIFQGRLTAAGTQYIAVTDRAVAGKSALQNAQILSPVAISDAVRKTEVVVDVRRPLAVAVGPKKGLDIGTVTLTPAAALKAQSIEVNSYISIPGLRMVRK